MTGFTKLFGSIVTSTIWQEPPATCKVWITMLAMADKHGEVQSSVPGLAHLGQVSLNEAEVALTKFLAPDKYSRTPDFEGRRIEPIDGGWRLLNHDKYRFKMSDDDRRERDRVRKQKYRASQRETCPTECGTTRDTMGQDGNVLEIQHAEAEADTDEKPSFAHPPDVRNRAECSTLAAEVYADYPRKVGKAKALKAIERAIVAVAKRAFLGDLSAAKGWLKARVERFAQSPQGKREDKQFIPYPETWFNGGRYDDDETEWCWVSAANGKSSSRPRTYTETQDPSEGFEEIVSRPRPAWAVERQQ